MAFEMGAHYLALPRAPQSWVITGILPTSGLLNIFGEPKAGKTYLALDLALAIADESRTHFCEWPVMTHGLVWYLQIDTPRGTFQEDYVEKAVARGMNIARLGVADQQIVEYPFNILGDGKAWLRKQYTEATVKPVCLIVDTLRDSHGSDENDSGVMRNVITSFVDAVKPGAPCGEECSERCSCRTPPAIVLLSHQKKMGSDEQVNLMSANRGSNYIAGRMDAVMRVAEGDIRAQSRSMPLTVLNGYRRDPFGFWIKFEPDIELANYNTLQAAGQFKSDNAKHELFAKTWGVSIGTAKNWFTNLKDRGAHDCFEKKLK